MVRLVPGEGPQVKIFYAVRYAPWAGAPWYWLKRGDRIYWTQARSEATLLDSREEAEDLITEVNHPELKLEVAEVWK